MNVPSPRQTRLDLHWRLAGVPVRITPLFWAAGAILGIRYYADPDGGSLGYFVFWMAALLIGLLVHELAHVFVGRLFGMKPEVILYGLGGLTRGLDTVPGLGARLAVLLAGPLASAMIATLVFGLTLLPFPDTFRQWGWGTAIATGLFLLLRINFWWALVNLLPLWPLDGGQAVCAVSERLWGKRGQTVALALSVLVAGALAVLVALRLSGHLGHPYDQRYLLNLEEDVALLVFCFLLWAGAFKALWESGGVAPTLPDAAPK
jgi:Zn-dependent protease